LLAFRCSFISLIFQFLLHCLSVRALEWDGLEGSLAKFGCSVGFERFANVPESEGMGAMGILILSFFTIIKQ
jgi:hypothetical protein